MTDHDISTLNDIMRMQDKLKEKQEEIKDAVAILAERMTTKATRINSIIKLVRKEQADPGTIEFEQELLDNAEKVTR